MTGLKKGDRVRVKVDFEGVVIDEPRGPFQVRVRDEARYYGDRVWRIEDVEKIGPALPTKKGAVVRSYDAKFVFMRTTATGWTDDEGGRWSEDEFERSSYAKNFEILVGDDDL